jgi:2-polyprenyl-6-methoxyphenol hydroxylase-like FAD-dependent oxidoreductase
LVQDRGQGLNNSILDASNLMRQLEKADLASADGFSKAISAYEKELWERGNEAVLSSNENTLSLHDWAKLQQSPLFKAGLSRKVASKTATEQGADASK